MVEMVDTQIAPPDSPVGRVLKVIEERHEAGEPPFVDVLEVVDALADPDITVFRVNIAILRLVCERRLWFALDGIRLLHSEQ